MNDDRRKMLTEYIGECWIEIVASPYRSDGIAENKNRTFTTWADLGAVYSKMVEMVDGTWEAFCNRVINEYYHDYVQIESIEDTFHFHAWLFCLNHPEQITDRMELAAEFLEERDANK